LANKAASVSPNDYTQIRDKYYVGNKQIQAFKNMLPIAPQKDFKASCEGIVFICIGRRDALNLFAGDRQHIF